MSVWIHSLRNRLTVVFGGLSLVASLGLAAYIGSAATTRLTAERGQDHASIARVLANTLGATLTEREREIVLLSQRPTFMRDALGSADMRRALELMQRSYRHYAWIGVADTVGVVRSAGGGLLEGVSVGQRPWFARGLAGSYLGDAHEAVLLAKKLPVPDTGEPLRFIDFAAPIRDDAGRVRGVVATHAQWSWVAEVLHNFMPDSAERDGTEVYIVDRNGALLHPYDSIGKLELPAALPPDGRYAVLDWAGTPYLTSLAGVKSDTTTDLGWRVLIRQPLDSALAAVAELRRTVLLAGLAVTLLTMLLAYRLAGQFSRPVRQLADDADRIRQGDETVPLEATTRLVELRQLAGALQGMTATLLSRKQALEESNLTLERKVQERTAALEQANRELDHLARHDALTGLHNRLACNEYLHGEFLRMQRSGKRYAVLLLDIDHFKRVNDTYGHDAGDAVLRHVAAVVKAAARTTDFVARLGGEEFLVVLPETYDGAALVAEKIRAAVAAASAPPVGTVTVSIGVAFAAAGDADADSAVNAADAALYRAKAAGRNRVVVQPD